MKKSIALLVAGAVLGVLVWLNVQRVMQGGPGSVVTGGQVLPPPKTTGSVPASATRNAAAKLEQVVVNIDTVGRPVSVPVPGFFGMESRFVTPEGSGSGVIVRSDGFIVTNNHVIENAQQISVTLNNGNRVKGEVWARDPNYDLAVVKIPRSGLPFAVLGNSDKVQVGDPVIAVGNALGLGTTVTSGIISAKERAVGGEAGSKGLAKAIQTDAAINRGNSGGALALMDGEVIGINTAILSSNGGGSIGIGFAIPANTVRTVATELIRNRKYQAPPQAFMGIAYGANNPDDAQLLKERYGFVYPSVTDGILVASVVDGGPADRAGIKVFDNILTVDGKAIKGTDGFQKIIRGHRPGDAVSLTLFRPALGRKITLRVSLSAVPQGMGEGESQPQPQQTQPRRGFPIPF